MVLVRHGFQEYVVDEVFLVVFKILVTFCKGSLPSLILQHTHLQKNIVYHWKWIGSGIFIYLCMQGKVFPVHALKMWGSGGIAARLLNLGTNWRLQVPMSV